MSLLLAAALAAPGPDPAPGPAAGPVPAADYLVVFAADAARYKATQAHTFAALVRVETPPGGPPRVADVHSISWLPETMTVRGLAIRPEKGRNVPLGETLDFYHAGGGHVCAWGPFLVRPELAATFRARVATVESSFRYKGACWLSRRDVCDCARAVEEMARPDRRYIGAFGYGAAAASSVVRTFTPWLVDPASPHPWVAPLIGLDSYPLIWRAHGDYSTRRDQMKAFRRP